MSRIILSITSLVSLLLCSHHALAQVEFTRSTGSVYKVMVSGVEHSKHTEWHKASESAANAAMLCECEVGITYQLNIRVNYTKPTKSTSVSLEWGIPNKREDGSVVKIEELDYIELDHNGSVSKLPVNISSKTISVREGKHSFRVRVMDKYGLYSKWSDAATVTI